ncbi:putative PurR-regulated permease PerM [Actinoplanes tereljensis]|uniref:AI-2E family transporter n=1 Tax=Paractinoplanes tereljensis TaxID=571912 RepID=A0A919TTN6_9ACTN|nr:AI-2E family transporter [Actinoplanes tereljensis]GIF21891.1 AI-2E family transporter [Actinoplanes tereljensis]
MRSGTEPPPAGLPRGVIVLLGTACLVVVVGGMRVTADLLGPVFLALMLTVTISPIAVWMRSRGVPLWLAMIANVTAVYLLLVSLGTAMALSLARLIDLMPQYQEQFTDLRDQLTRTLAAAGVDQGQVLAALHEATDPGSVAHVVEFVFGGVAAALSNTVFLLAVLLFMCIDAVDFPARMRASAAERPEVIGALRSFASGTRRYLWVTTVFGLIVAVADTFLLWALGIPLPLLWGLLSFITNYIPNIGFIIGVIPPALLGLLQDGVAGMLWVVALYCAVNFVIQSVIQPKVVGDAVGLSASVSFLSLVFWGWVLGPLGALLAIPLSLLAKGLLVDIDPATRWINPLLSGTDNAEPPDRRDERVTVPTAAAKPH